MPIDVTNDVTGFGTKASTGARPVALWPAEAESAFVVHHEDGATTTIALTRGQVTFSRTATTTRLRIRTGAAPATMQMNGSDVTERAGRSSCDAEPGGWLFEGPTKSTWVDVPASEAAITVTWSG